jgi:predicted transcriptional regulator
VPAYRFISSAECLCLARQANTRYSLLAGRNRNPKKRQEKMGTTNAQALRRRNKKADQYAKQNYGSARTIGPRSVSVIYDIFNANKSGSMCSIQKLKERHPASSIEDVIVVLLGRKLIKRAKGQGRCYEVTAKGFEIAMLVNRSNITPGLGFVAIGVPMIR